MDRIFDRLSRVVLSWLNGRTDGAGSARRSRDSSYSDPFMQEAWEELDVYLNGDEQYRSETKSRSQHREKQQRREEEDRETRQESEILRQDYANLEVPFGAPFEEVKRSYKNLLRRYHPDRHTNDPEKLKLATEVTTKINASYDRIKTFKQSRRKHSS